MPVSLSSLGPPERGVCLPFYFLCSRSLVQCLVQSQAQCMLTKQTKETQSWGGGRACLWKNQPPTKGRGWNLCAASKGSSVSDRGFRLGGSRRHSWPHDSGWGQETRPSKGPEWINLRVKQIKLRAQAEWCGSRQTQCRHAVTGAHSEGSKSDGEGGGTCWRLQRRNCPHLVDSAGGRGEGRVEVHYEPGTCTGSVTHSCVQPNFH